MNKVSSKLLSKAPITVLAGSGTLVLALPQKGKCDYLFGSSAASNRTSPAPASAILARYAG